MIPNRDYKEATLKNLFRKPEIYGIPVPSALFIVCVVSTLELGAGNSPHGTIVAISSGVILYLIFRFVGPRLPIGFEKDIVYGVARRLPFQNRLTAFVSITENPGPTLFPFEGESEDRQITRVSEFEEILWNVPLSSNVFEIRVDRFGARSLKLEASIQSGLASRANSEVFARYKNFKHVFTLTHLPTHTTPKFMTDLLGLLRRDFVVLIRVDSIDQAKLKSRVSHSRKSSAFTGTTISDIDQEVTFEETSRALEGISRGLEKCVEVAVVVLCNESSALSTEFFKKEKHRDLPILSSLGLMDFHRSHTIRTVTASHLFPFGLDPIEDSPALLVSNRGKPVYFNPIDPSFQALHWLVVGASGSGKSFLTGSILSRLIRSGTQLSVLFVDHGYSFRRLVRSHGAEYLVPNSLQALDTDISRLERPFQTPGTMAGVELSELTLLEKRKVGSKIFNFIECLLKARKAPHPIFIVLDECWQFLAAEPEPIQRAFREFRKFNAGAIAISQSLSDLLKADAGQSIFQNAPIKILLRQDEDLKPYQSALGLEDEALRLTRYLKQKKGEYSEVLIKTPNWIKTGKLLTTQSEFSLLRTDNIRQELAASRG